MWLRTPLVGRGALVILGVLLLVFALAFGAPLTACGGPENEEASDAPHTTVQAAQKVSGKKPANVARAAAAEIDEASIRASLAQLTGVFPPRSQPGRPPRPARQRGR